MIKAIILVFLIFFFVKSITFVDILNKVAKMKTETYFGTEGLVSCCFVITILPFDVFDGWCQVCEKKESARRLEVSLFLYDYYYLIIISCNFGWWVYD